MFYESDRLCISELARSRGRNQGIGGEGETIQMSVVGETGPMRVLGLEPRTYALKVRCSAD